MQTDLDLPFTGEQNAAATCDLIAALDANPAFRRDSLLGGVFHPGHMSYREVCSTESVHILIRGDRVSAHVDDVSPLVIRADGTSRYAWGRVVVHNLAVMVGDVARRVRGQHGRQRCNLHCQAELVEVEDAVPPVMGVPPAA